MGFSFCSPAKIVIGEGESLNLNAYISEDIRRILIIHGASFAKKPIFDEINNRLNHKTVTAYQTPAGEPSPNSVDAATAFAIQSSAQMLIGIGGGSVMDTAKAAAVLVTNEGGAIDYLEGVGMEKRITHAPLPLILAPTTAGTGTEVTKNAVISSRELGFKKSMRDDRMLADTAVIDPLLTEDLPRHVLAASGMDAICQLVESYTTKNANSVTDALAYHHAALAVESILPAYQTDDASARMTLGVAAMVSGLTLANAGLGLAHGIASGLGALTDIPHGIACGILLPASMRFNIARGVDKYAALGEAFSKKIYKNKKTACDAAVFHIERLNAALEIPHDLKRFKLTNADIVQIAKASIGSSLSKNPTPVSLADCITILQDLI